MLKAVGCTLSIRFDLWLDIKEVPIISYRMAIAGWCLGNPVTLLCQLGAVNFIASSRALWAEALVESSLCHFKFTYISFLLGMCQKSLGFFIHSYNDRLSDAEMTKWKLMFGFDFISKYWKDPFPLTAAWWWIMVDCDQAFFCYLFQVTLFRGHNFYIS